MSYHTLSHGLHPDWLVLVYCVLINLPVFVPAVVDNHVVGSDDVVVGHILFLRQ